MGRRAPRGIGEALSRVRAGLEPPSLIAAVQVAWPEAVGRQIAGVSRPISERHGIVTVHCSDAIWAEELTLMRETLLERLNSALTSGGVVDLRFRLGDL